MLCAIILGFCCMVSFTTVESWRKVASVTKSAKNSLRSVIFSKNFKLISTILSITETASRLLKFPKIANTNVSLSFKNSSNEISEMLIILYLWSVSPKFRSKIILLLSFLSRFKLPKYSTACLIGIKGLRFPFSFVL